MKILFYIFLILIVSCKTPEKKAIKPKAQSQIDSINHDTGNPDILDTGEIISISPEHGDTLRYNLHELNAIKLHILDPKTGFVTDPDKSYPGNEGIEYKTPQGNKKIVLFSSEVDKDNYYALYAYFLKLRNGNKAFQVRRNKTIEIFRNLNEIFSDLTHGGTYFGHQYRRILGHAEYSIYKYLENEDDYQGRYDLSEQKKLYLNSLRQTIANEINSDNANGMTKDDKARVKNYLFKLVDKLGKLIIDYYYLKNAQDFQQSHY